MGIFKNNPQKDTTNVEVESYGSDEQILYPSIDISAVYRAIDEIDPLKPDENKSEHIVQRLFNIWEQVFQDLRDNPDKSNEEFKKSDEILKKIFDKADSLGFTLKEDPKKETERSDFFKNKGELDLVAQSLFLNLFNNNPYPLMNEVENILSEFIRDPEKYFQLIDKSSLPLSDKLAVMKKIYKLVLFRKAQKRYIYLKSQVVSLKSLNVSEEKGEPSISELTSIVEDLKTRYSNFFTTLDVSAVYDTNSGKMVVRINNFIRKDIAGSKGMGKAFILALQKALRISGYKGRIIAHGISDTYQRVGERTDFKEVKNVNTSKSINKESVSNARDYWRSQNFTEVENDRTSMYLEVVDERDIWNVLPTPVEVGKPKLLIENKKTLQLIVMRDDPTKLQYHYEDDDISGEYKVIGEFNSEVGEFYINFFTESEISDYIRPKVNTTWRVPEEERVLGVARNCFYNIAKFDIVTTLGESFLIYGDPKSIINLPYIPKELVNDKAKLSQFLKEFFEKNNINIIPDDLEKITQRVLELYSNPKFIKKAFGSY